MRNRRWVALMLLLVVPGLLLTVSCTRDVRPEPVMTDDVDTMAQEAAEKAHKEELARQRALEEERLREERIRKEREKAATEEAERRAAKDRFLSEDIRFDFDSAVLLTTAEELLKQKAEWLRANSGVAAIVEGHCDERGTNQYNLALGDRRAGTVRTYLINLGIGASRLTTISYGEEQPADSGHDENAWKKNRRARFVIE